eukprot:TRINITY_DN12699_c0_g1_i1.p1 TRINITY_DN12699_c0_g1~~TRINITY_DN12699_c0_g1_i1.p1  ORF type:complete len:465 (-),score=157.96 TRINITY_DN12699_c0_g1_i1:113-1465(-)
MSRFVRSSKYRHVFGKAYKKELCYDDLQVSRGAWDSNKVAVNDRFLAVQWEARGGGSFTVLKHDQTGKQPASLPLIQGHKSAVLDIEFSPFNDYVIASASEDGTTKIWSIPEEGLTEHMVDPIQNLVGHRRKVGAVRFNPVAQNVLATASTDYTVKLWDIEKGDVAVDLKGQHSDIIQSMNWSHDGKLLITACKDKHVRVIDPRSATEVHKIQAHMGVKGSRAIWLGEKNKIFTCGFSKASDRQFSLWDPANMSAALHSENVDTSSGGLMPFYDNDTNVLFLVGKGDGNVRYYEIVDDKPFVYYLSEYKSSTPQRGGCFYPKTALNTGECEVARMAKVTNTGVEPISFTVPRKSDMFQDDLFPETDSHTPALQAPAWFAGGNGVLSKISLEDGFVAPKRAEIKVEKKEEKVGPKTEKELREAYASLTARVATLEIELAQKDATIKSLGGK